MAKRGNVQFISTPRGDDLAVLPRKDYDALVKAATEDAADARAVKASRAALARGDEIALPRDIALRIANGESPVRVLREWRGVTQEALARLAEIGQGYLSDIEAGRRKGPADLHKRLAKLLAVPIAALIDD